MRYLCRDVMHDRRIYVLGDEIQPPYVQPPVVPGHEFFGIVVVPGKCQGEARHRCGDMVTGEQIVPCWNAGSAGPNY